MLGGDWTTQHQKSAGPRSPRARSTALQRLTQELQHRLALPHGKRLEHHTIVLHDLRKDLRLERGEAKACSVWRAATEPMRRHSSVAKKHKRNVMLRAHGEQLLQEPSTQPAIPAKHAASPNQRDTLRGRQPDSAPALRLPTKGPPSFCVIIALFQLWRGAWPRHAGASFAAQPCSAASSCMFVCSLQCAYVLHQQLAVRFLNAQCGKAPFRLQHDARTAQWPQLVRNVSVADADRPRLHLLR